MDVCSSTEMGTPVASYLGTGDHGPNATEADHDRSRETRLCLVNVRLVGKWEVIRSFLFARRLEIANRLPQADLSLPIRGLGSRIGRTRGQPLRRPASPGVPSETHALRLQSPASESQARSVPLAGI